MMMMMMMIYFKIYIEVLCGCTLWVISDNDIFQQTFGKIYGIMRMGKHIPELLQQRTALSGEYGSLMQSRLKTTEYETRVEA